MVSQFASECSLSDHITLTLEIQVVLLDDDTLLDNDFFIRHDILEDPKCGGYCVGIGVNRSPPLNLWEIAIDFEYRAISYAFGARAGASTIPFCHGICAVYKLDLMIEHYRSNWSLPGGLPVST